MTDQHPSASDAAQIASPPFFDALRAWAALSAAEQAAIGRIALTLGCAASGLVARFEDDQPFQACEVAVEESTQMLVTAYEHTLADLGENLLPDLNAIGTRTCTACGCTDSHGCPDGCWWADETLCSACADQPDTSGQPT